MDSLSILQQNSDFVMGAYNMSALMGGMFLLVLLDTGLKGWAMWRAARMEKKSWFIALLIINSMGILPLIFLLMTREEYGEKMPKKNASIDAAM